MGEWPGSKPRRRTYVPRPRWDIGTRVADHHLRALRQDVRGGRLDPARQHLGDLADTGGRPGEVGGKFESLRLVAAVFDAVGGGDGLIELAVPDTQLGELPLEALTRPPASQDRPGPGPAVINSGHQAPVAASLP
jgi:hypothetical protein